MATANIQARISLDSSQFSAGLAKVKSGLASIGSSFSKIALIGSTAAAAIGGLGAVKLGEGIKEALDYGRALGDLSARTGVSVRDLTILEQAFKDAGLGSEEIGTSINKLQKNIVEANPFFNRLGINLEDLKKKAPIDQFQAIAEKINSLKDPTERSAAAMELFGRSGAKLLSVFGDSSAIQNATNVIGGQAEIFERNAEAFHRISASFEAIGTKFRGFFAGVAESLLPTLERLADFIANLDLSGLGQRLGEALQSGVNILTNAFTQGRLAELLALTIETGSVKGADFMLRILKSSFAVLSEGLGQAFAILAEPAFWAVMVDTFVAAVNKMAEAFVTIMQGPLKKLQDGLVYIGEKVSTQFRGGRNLKDISGADEKTFLTDTSEYRKNSDEASARAAAGILNLQSKGIVSIDALGKAFKDNFSKDTAFSGLADELQKQLLEAANDLNKPLAPLNKAKSNVPLTPDREGALTPQIPRIEAASALERIGAHLPGGGTSAVNFARQTSENTKKSNDLLSQIKTAIDNWGKGSIGATFQ